jgi:rhamnose utilization protein RhaD (predicted bifunctional aldolase and dehydrogenase)
MSNILPPGSNPEFDRLRELTARIGADPSLTQASTGNSSAKLEGELCIKRSGRWMSAAMRDDIFIRLNLSEVSECLRQGLDPGELFPGASLETAMHAAMPHRVVVHVHSVNAIAWAVRADGLSQIQSRLQGLRWQWIPYLPSGLPLARGIEQVCQRRPDTDLFVLANHGLVVGGKDVRTVGALLDDVHQRLDIVPRSPWSADHGALADAGMNDAWEVPDDDAVHALATQPVSQRIVSGGILYPCQAIFSGDEGIDAFRAIPQPVRRKYRHSNRPFLIVERCGVLINRSASPAAIAMLSGLARVVQRLNTSAPIRYLTEDEVAGLSPEVAHRYCELAGAGSARADGSRMPDFYR